MLSTSGMRLSPSLPRLLSDDRLGYCYLLLIRSPENLNAPRYLRINSTLQTPQIVKRAAPQHLITSEFISMSPMIAQETHKKEWIFLGYHSPVISVISINVLYPFATLYAASKTPYSSFTWLSKDLTRPLPVPPGIHPIVILCLNSSQSALCKKPFTTSKISPSPLTVTIES